MDLRQIVLILVIVIAVSLNILLLAVGVWRMHDPFDRDSWDDR